MAMTKDAYPGASVNCHRPPARGISRDRRGKNIVTGGVVRTERALVAWAIEAGARWERQRARMKTGTAD
jgi:hypothetical protein